MRNYSAKDLGKFGEEKAVEYLISKGYTILCRNFRWKGGEIDIIAEDKARRGAVVFFEVKTRRNRSFGLPCESVTPAKAEKMKRAVMFCAAVDRRLGGDFRIDVIEILVMGEKPYIRHLENVM